MPKITVLMTVYNGGEYLSKSIDSVLAQTYKDFEFLIIDDKSTDDSIKVIKTYQDKRIRLLRNKENLGQTKSLNIGLSNAAGEYVARIDADDIAVSSWLKDQADFISKNPNYVVISMNALIFNQFHKITQKLLVPSGHDQQVLRSLYSSPINHGGCVMKRKKILKYNGYDSTLKISSDFDLWTRLLMDRQPLAVIKKPGMMIRWHEESISKTLSGPVENPEMAEVIKRSVKRFSTYKFLEGESYLYWQLFYDIDRLSDDEFLKALKMLGKIYSSINDQYLDQPSCKGEALKNVRYVIFVKRIFGLLNQNNLQDVRNTAHDYISKYGKINILFIAYILSFCGLSITKVIPKLYSFLRRIQAQGNVKVT